MFSKSSILSLAVLCAALPLPALAALPAVGQPGSQPTCTAALQSRRQDPNRDARKLALKAISKFNAYFTAVNERILERDYLVRVAELALLAEEHLLLMGPPGNAKSQFSDMILGNMKTPEGKPSYYRIQMTPETTLSETHGPLDFRTLNRTGKYTRLLEEGMLLSRNVFVDEIFDARSNAQRNILGLLAERAHSQGPHTVKGEIETAFAATNRYISEVYERTGDDSPKALLDRFALSAFVPGEFENMESYVALIRSPRSTSVPLPELTFDDIELLRQLVPQVEIPVRVAKFLAVLSSRIRAESESLEQAALKSYKEKIKNGDDAGIPYRATKYHSPRTIGKAASILRAITVRDWIRTSGKRKLEVTTEDIKELESFFTLNGPSDAFVEDTLKRTSNPHERAQLLAILQERALFRQHYEKIQAEINDTTVSYALTELYNKLEGTANSKDREQLIDQLTASLYQVRAEIAESKKLRASELTGQVIGLELVEEFVVDGLSRLLGASTEQSMEARLEKHALKRQQEKLKEEEERKAEAARQAELEAKTAEQDAHTQKAALAALRKQLITDLISENSWEVIHEIMNVPNPEIAQHAFGYDEKTKTIYHYGRRADVVTKISLDDGQVRRRTPGIAKRHESLSGRITVLPNERLLISSPDEAAGTLVNLGRGPNMSVPIGVPDNRFVVSPKGDTIYTLDLDELVLSAQNDNFTGAPEQFSLSDFDLTGYEGDIAKLRYEWSMQKTPGAMRVTANGRTILFTDQLFQNVFTIDLKEKKLRWLAKVDLHKGTLSPVSAPYTGIDAHLVGKHTGFIALTDELHDPLQPYWYSNQSGESQAALWPKLALMLRAGRQGLELENLLTSETLADHVLGSTPGPGADAGPLHPRIFGNDAVSYFMKDQNGAWKIRFVRIGAKKQ